MQFKIQLMTVSDTGEEIIYQVASFERDSVQPHAETLGLTLEEGKSVLNSIQAVVLEQQIAGYLAQVQNCADCKKPRRSKGHHRIIFRTVFGNIPLRSPRWHHCDCQAHERKTFSPLANLLTEHTAPELLFLETKWASLLSYGLTVKLLQEVLPIGEKLNAQTVRQHLHRVAEKGEQALGDEQFMFVEGCQRDWDGLPLPDGPLTVTIDGGYVKARNKEGWFEVITGKSKLTFKRDALDCVPSVKCFGFVQTVDPKPKRRLFEVLKAQGMTQNQQVIFLSDGGETVRNLQLYLSPNAEHVLDWFHITMRLTVLGQYLKGVKQCDPDQGKEMEDTLESIKWYLWHGNAFRALQEIEDLGWRAESLEIDYPKLGKLACSIQEFQTYIHNNVDFIVNYGERYRNGETISSAVAESTVNQVISKRMVKKQSMQWTPRGAHLLLQMRTRVLNNELEEAFREWYPQFRLIPSGEDRLTA